MESQEGHGIQPLTSAELNVCRRGRNAVSKGRTPKRLTGESGNQNIYQDSTAWEALIGYLYIKNPTRCQEILEWTEQHLEEP